MGARDCLLCRKDDREAQSGRKLISVGKMHVRETGSGVARIQDLLGGDQT